MTYSTVRLATALTEAGHSCDIAMPASSTLTADTVPVLRISGIPWDKDAIGKDTDVAAALSEGKPDLIVVANNRLDLLEISSRISPTLIHSHLHWAVCPDSARYWGRLHHECLVHSGLKCLALRPLLACSGRREVLLPSHVKRQQRLLKLLRRGGLGIIAVSGQQVKLLLDHGIPERFITLIPNLGMRLTSAELRQHALDTPPEDRSALVFFGRLSREKGANLLPALADRRARDSLLVFGEGYLQQELQSEPSLALRGHVSQERIAGILQWARAVYLPSLWPEPGALNGIDAEMFATPLASFTVGAAFDLPHASLFSPGDTRRMGTWGRLQPHVASPRSSDSIAATQREYWRLVGTRADTFLSAFATAGEFPPLDLGAVREDITGATLLSQSHPNLT
jgi:glycosyltransferase involved in cell wall biosynthesis